MKKLVQLDPHTHRYLQVDKNRARREATDLLDYIKVNVDPSHDEHGIWKFVVPLCEKVIQNKVHLPIAFEDRPLKYQVREGLLTQEFEEKYAPFALTITGTPREIFKNVCINGERYAYVDFE